MEKYIIVMQDGIIVSTTGVNLAAVNTILNTNNSLAAKIGKKSMSKYIIVAVAKIETLEKKKGDNISIAVGNTTLNTVTDNVDKFLESITNDVNKKEFVLVNDSILINRAAFQCAEEVELLEEQSETQA